MPRPNKGESEQNFVNRCVVDPEAMRDFPKVGQRLAFCYSQYERYKKPINKNFVESWQRAYENERDKAEAKNIASVRRFYNQEYAKGISQFVENNNIQLLGLFKEDDLNKLYQQVYVDTGLHFANWYARNFDKLATKGINPSQYKNVWQTNFAKYAASVAATNVSLVQETARKTLIQVTTKILRDPEFMLLGAREQARILRSQFDGYSKYQAERFIRTETTRISNLAVRDAATTVYGKDQLLKRWSVRLDGRERLAHREMASKDPIPFEEDFIVGGDPMAEPGDGSRTSAKNVVNCRCSVVYIPREEAETTGFTDIGFGLGGQDIPRSTTIQEIAAGLATTIAKPEPKPTATFTGPNQGKGEPLGDYLKRVDHPGYTTWERLNKLEKEGYNVGNLEFTKLLKKDIDLLLTNSSSYSDVWNQVKLNTQRFGKDLKTIVAHEYGHAIHNQLGWAKKGASNNEIVLKYFKKYQNDLGVGMGGPKITALKNNLNRSLKLSSDKFKELRKKFPNLTDKQFKEYWTDTADFLGAITRNEVGYGHTNLYYNSYYKQHAEFLAHIAENYYNGNPVFKAMFPKIYKETLQIWDELINSI